MNLLLISTSSPIVDLPVSIGFLNDYNWFLKASLSAIAYLIIPAFILAVLIGWCRLVFLGDTQFQKIVFYRIVFILFILTIYPYLFSAANKIIVSLTNFIIADSNNINCDRVKLASLAVKRMEFAYSAWDDTGLIKFLSVSVWKILGIKLLLFLTNAAIYIVFKVREYLLVLIYCFLPYMIALSFFEHFYQQAKRLAHAAVLILAWYFIYSAIICFIFPSEFCISVIHISNVQRASDGALQSEMFLKCLFLLVCSIALPLIAAFLYGKSVAGVEAAIPAAAIMISRSTTRFLSNVSHNIRNTVTHSIPGGSSSSATNIAKTASHNTTNYSSSGSSSFNISGSSIPSAKLQETNYSYKGNN